jgi:hypothetical protein
MVLISSRIPINTRVVNELGWDGLVVFAGKVIFI